MPDFVPQLSYEEAEVILKNQLDIFHWGFKFTIMKMKL